MVRKPAPGLPDVFARPGGAPQRGTSLEDLPNTAISDPPAPEPPAPMSPAPMSPVPESPVPTPPVPESRAQPPSSRVPALVWIVLVISLTAPLWEPPVLAGLDIPTPSERAAAQNAADLARQDVTLATLEQRLASTMTQLDATRADLALASQRAAEASTQARAEVLLRLADTLRGPAPFGAELAVLRAAGTTQPVLTQLAPYGATGAPTIDQLARDLRNLHDGMERAIRQANPGSWMDLINWTGVNGRQPPVPIDPDLRAARQALSRLAVGDIAGAIEQVNQIDGPFQPGFADWAAEAHARLAADSALREIDALIAHPAATP